jgi:hypothetical protein
LGQAVVVTISVPWVPPLELLLDDELLPELLLPELLLLELLLLELLEVDEDDVEPLPLEDEPEPSLLLLPLPPQPAIARHAIKTNGPSAVWRITPVCDWWQEQRNSSAYNRKAGAGENVAIQ